MTDTKNQPIKANARIIVGLSGGVDSAVSALLLKQQGYNVEAMFMKNWEQDDDEGYCHSAEDLKYAQAIAEKLEIPLHKVNFAKEYWDNVFQNFLAEYKAGRTPNPDILCNKEIKFKAFLDHAKQLGADYIATGHYAGVTKNNDTGIYELQTAQDENKDQTYFLYTLGQQQLKHVIFPLQNISKPEVRNIAAAHNLINHDRKDSTGICFIGERKFRNFLSRFLKPKLGPIVTDNNKKIGEHQGIMFYTIGQRQGLHIGGQKNSENAPWYVAEKIPATNTLVVVQNQQHSKLFNQHVNAKNLSWCASTKPKQQQFDCFAKIRYRQQAAACNVLIKDDNTISVKFNTPQRAVTAGQAIVLYIENQCLGGATIIDTEETNGNI